MVRSSYFIFSPLQDILFVLFTPLLILGTFAAARYGGWMDGLVAFGLALAVGHYLPGIVRAYFDRELFRRFRVRLIVVPVLLLATTSWFAYQDLHAVIFLQMLWGGWHWAMQTYGFARIYDAKVPSAGRTPAVLDKLLCLLWFGTWMLSADPTAYLKTFYESGGPFVRSSAVGLFTQSWIAITVALTLFYVIHTLSAIRQGHFPNPLKLVFVAVTFIYLSHTTSMIDRPVVGLVMFESWHDIQYLAIVWLFNINRGKKRAEAGPVIHFLFRPKPLLIGAYIGLCLTFGTLNFAWHLFDNPAVARVVLSLVTATALFHYYLDGFIWRIREVQTRDALGVSSSAELPARGVVQPRPMPLVPAWGVHVFLWMMFLIPAALLFVTESRSTDLRIHERVIDSLPNSARARYDMGKSLESAGRFREARVHLEKALELAPDLLPARISLGTALANQGDLDSARMHLEKALASDPKSAEAHNNLAVVLDQQGDTAGAKSHLEQAVNYSPKQASFHSNLGRLLAKSGNLAAARLHQERALRLDPNFAEAHYQLGLTVARQGDFAAAVGHLQQALRIDPSQFLAHNALGGVFMNLGRTDEARVHFEEALRINPGYSSAQQNLANLIEKSNSLP